MATIKNQLKSFTADSFKKEATNFFVFLGGVSGGTASIDSSDISILTRITKDEISIVVPRINWKANSIYEPYYFGSSGINSYCYNNVTDMVYVCVGKNQPSGLIGDVDHPSTVSPTHIVGKQTYSDGYSWMALYKIDLYLSGFLTETELPVNSLYDYTSDITSTSYVSKYNTLCGDAGNTGNCYFYYNQDTKDPITSEIFLKGQQVQGIGIENWICASCHSVGEALNYKTIHLGNNSVQSKIIRNAIDELESKINQNSIDVNDRFYTHYLNYKYEKDLNGGIINLQLDVTNLSIEDRIVKVSEPVVKVLDPLGDGAIVTLSTYYDIRRNAFIANGINLKSTGSNYVNPLFSIKDALSNKLENNIKSIISFGIEHPSSFLPNTRVSIIKKITNVDLETIGTDQTVFSKFGIVSNVLTTDGVIPTIKTEPNESLKGRITTKVDLYPYSGELPELDLGEVFLGTEDAIKVDIKTEKLIAESSDYASKLVSLKETFDELEGLTYSTLELSTVDEVSFEAKTLVKIDNTEYTVKSILEPEYKIDKAEYIVTNVAKNNIVLQNTGSQTSAKLSFLI